MGRRRWVAAAVPALLLLGVAGTVALRPAVDGCGGGPAAVLLPTAEQVPDLVGDDEGTARLRAEQAGVTWSARQETWRVDAADRGTVLEQSGGGCEDPLRLVLSTGGPLVDPARQAPAAQEALGPDPGPVRVVRLSEGTALQSDDVLTGECAAVERVQEEEPVGAGVEVGCYPAPVDALVAAVRDGSGFLGPDGDDVRVLQSLSGAWMAEAAAGWTADRAVDGWRLTVLVGSTRGLDDLRCRPASAYEVCDVEQRADGTEVATAQVLGERPLGRPFVSLETVVQGGPWRVRVVLSPDVDGSPGPDRPTAPPADLDTLVALADAARLAVEPVSPAP